MSRDNLGSEKTIVLHNCLIKNERYDLVITPHSKTKGFIRSKRQKRKKTIIMKQKTNYQKTFFKTKRRSLCIRNKHNTRISRFKRLDKQK